MEIQLVQQFKIKCRDCHFRETAPTEESAINVATNHLSYDWRSNTHEHTLKITEILLVSKKEELE
jgi:hypothetical protein